MSDFVKSGKWRIDWLLVVRFSLIGSIVPAMIFLAMQFPVAG